MQLTVDRFRDIFKSVPDRRWTREETLAGMAKLRELEQQGYPAVMAMGRAMRELKRLCEGHDEQPIAEPLDIIYDGYTLRDLLKLDEKANRENVTAQCARKAFTANQRTAVQAYWSAQLRDKVEASAAADRARQPSVMVECDEL